jgi:hypothetical protein
MKPKLLITLGCSYTEGVGCYDLSTIPKEITRKNYYQSELYSEIYNKNLDKFHENGWPNKVGRKLGFDEVINLGLGGSSNSGHLKLFIEKFYDSDLSNYDVLIIWMMSDPSRFSFYSNGYNNNFILNNFFQSKEIETAYLNLIKDVDHDTLLEQVFYMKLMEQFCENKNYKLIFTYWSPVNKKLNSYFKTKKLLTPHYEDILDMGEDFENYHSPICWHPNEAGYEVIANKIVQNIKIYHPYVKIDKYNENIKWKWGGNPSYFKKNTII